MFIERGARYGQFNAKREGSSAHVSSGGNRQRTDAVISDPSYVEFAALSWTSEPEADVGGAWEVMEGRPSGAGDEPRLLNHWESRVNCFDLL
jgi:hypothetical protein